ncbi:outer membrane protein assembly factor BamB family protein [Rubripirellula reticaptiva]|uniref:Outer membrane biogenesis protein BamB n=1 Tax=Rubripirellula reticaptiva TaxID=2528013 RepID=A0A5C6EGZ2_9BACT|nr:PQQ-binding-like beta-propeller repeat protein [Rubripirellula reticaptiva]TWU49093.1 outer membrane biogenesis protein BamB [Rubripirellula reticaptiva]
MIRSIRHVAFCVLICLIAGPICGEDWPHWRGAERSDSVAESSGWNDTKWPLHESWRVQVPEGASSPLVVNGQLFTMGWQQDQDHVVCLDAMSGKEVWRKSYPCPKYGRLATGDEGLYSGPSSTPEFDTETGLLYTLSTDGDLNCWNTHSKGRRVWNINLYDTFDVPQRPKVGRSGLRDYGYTSSPLIHGDWLIVEVGAKQGNLIAFDKHTGKQAWASQSNASAGHNAGPVQMTVEGMPCVAVHNHDGLLVARMDRGSEGHTVATYPWITSFANNIASVSVDDDCVLLTSAYNQNKIAKLRITLRGAELLWEQKAASKVCTPLIHNGHVYWAWQNLFCLDFETGQIIWRGGTCGDAGSCIATADGRLVVWAGDGDLSLVELADRSPEKYTELASLKRLGNSDAWPHVALSNGRIYCKDRDGQIICLKLPK